MDEVNSKLWDLLDETHWSDLVGWQQFYLPAKLSVLEFKYNKHLEEVQQLKDKINKTTKI